MLSYRALLDDATKHLFDGSDTPRIDAEVLMQHVIQKPLAWLIAYGDTTPTADHIKDFYALVAARQNGQPIAYLTGSRDFWTLKLKVNEHVLIPRPDTETLVEEALARLPKAHNLEILDLGTGSGAIALSIAKERPQSKVLAVDLHENALEVAAMNAELNKVTNVDFLVSHWFNEIDTEKCFDLIVSNPPYVESGDPHLAQGDLRFEPDSALIADEQGLADLRMIIKTAPSFLASNGWLIVEHGFNQANEIATLFTNNGFTKIELFEDINELPRCTAGQLESRL